MIGIGSMKKFSLFLVAIVYVLAMYAAEPRVVVGAERTDL